MAEQFQHTPSLIVGVVDVCLAAAFLAFSRAAPDFRVFRKTGAYYLMIALEQLWEYHGGEGSDWVPRVIGIFLLVEMAAEAMEIQHRRWTLVMVPIYVATLILGWFPQFSYVRQWPLPSSAAVLAILIVQGISHGSSRDRLIAGTLTIHWFARLTAMSVVQRTLGIKSFFSVGQWNWGYASISQTLLGVLTLVVFVRALVADRRERQRMSSDLAAARAVQQVLIPESMPSTPGFEIHSGIQTVWRPGRGLLPDTACGGPKRVGGDRGCKWQGAARSNDGVSGGRDAAYPGGDHKSAGRASCGVEPAHDGTERWRIHHVPSFLRKAGRAGDVCQCGPSFTVS